MRQANRFEREKQNKKNGALPGLIFLLVLFLFPMMISTRVILIVVEIAVVLAVLGFCVGRRFAKARGMDAERNNSVPFRSVSPGMGKPCPNPETHRHFDTLKPCPNPEPHEHYNGVSQALTQVEQDLAAQKKRLENMRILYNAGILTREEYDYEVRRLKKL